MKKQINNDLIDMTAEEITEAENKTQSWENQKTQEADIVNSKHNKSSLTSE